MFTNVNFFCLILKTAPLCACLYVFLCEVLEISLMTMIFLDLATPGIYEHLWALLGSLCSLGTFGLF